MAGVCSAIFLGAVALTGHLERRRDESCAGEKGQPAEHGCGGAGGCGCRHTRTENSGGLQQRWGQGSVRAGAGSATQRTSAVHNHCRDCKHDTE